MDQLSNSVDRSTITSPSPEIESLAMYIAMVVRNELEDFHVQHLSDEQMKVLNPLIRNAIFTALHAYMNYDKSQAAKGFVDFNIRLIPNYWEMPELTENFHQVVAHFKQ